MKESNNIPKEKLWNGNYVKIWLANFMIFFSFMLLTPLLPTYLSETFHADKDTIGMVLSGYTITALVIRSLSGYMVDSFPRRIVLVASYALFSLFFTGYIIAGSLLLFTIVRTLHGAPFGATTVSNSTVAIDVLPSSRRAEGIGYYGLSNNIATAISPTVALLLFDVYHSYDLLFWLPPYHIPAKYARTFPAKDWADPANPHPCMPHSPLLPFEVPHKLLPLCQNYGKKTEDALLHPCGSVSLLPLLWHPLSHR